MTPTSARRERARYAALKRHRDANDPDLIPAHLRMREEATIAAFERALRIAPPITGPLHKRIINLINNFGAEV